MWLAWFGEKNDWETWGIKDQLNYRKAKFFESGLNSAAGIFRFKVNVLARLYDSSKYFSPFKSQNTEHILIWPFTSLELTQHPQKSCDVVESYGVFCSAVIKCFIFFLNTAYIQRPVGKNVEPIVQLKNRRRSRRSFYELKPGILYSKVTGCFAIKHDWIVYRSCQVARTFHEIRKLCKVIKITW